MLLAGLDPARSLQPDLCFTAALQNKCQPGHAKASRDQEGLEIQMV